MAPPPLPQQLVLKCHSREGGLRRVMNGFLFPSQGVDRSKLVNAFNIKIITHVHKNDIWGKILSIFTSLCQRRPLPPLAATIMAAIVTCCCDIWLFLPSQLQSKLCVFFVCFPLFLLPKNNKEKQVVDKKKIKTKTKKHRNATGASPNIFRRKE